MYETVGNLQDDGTLYKKKRQEKKIGRSGKAYLFVVATCKDGEGL